MLRPDRLGLVDAFLYLHCHLYFRTAIAQEDTPSPERWEPRRPEISDTLEQRRPRSVGPKQTLPEISSRDPTLKLMPSAKEIAQVRVFHWKRCLDDSQACHRGLP